MSYNVQQYAGIIIGLSNIIFAKPLIRTLIDDIPVMELFQMLVDPLRILVT